MVLGAGRGQVDLINAIKHYGHTAIVASIPGTYPGFKAADETCYVNIADPQAVCQAAKELHVDAVTTACLDTGITALGYTCEQLGLSGLSAGAATLSGDKLLMKQAFMDNGVSTARYLCVHSEEELSAAQRSLHYPLIVKAIDLQGSRGINIAHDEKELFDGFHNTMQETGKDYCIVEEFIEGYEFGAQAFVYDHEVLFVMPAGDITFRGNTNIPVGHYVPLALDTDMLGQVEKEVKLAIKAIGLNNCAVNVDMIYKDGRVYMIELTGRIGANCLPQLTSIYYGIDIYKMIIDAALGVNPKSYFNTHKKAPSAGYAKMLFSDQNGVLKAIVNDNPKEDPAINEVTFFVQPGDTVRRFTNSRDCLGQIVVNGADAEACQKALERAEKKIQFMLE